MLTTLALNRTGRFCAALSTRCELFLVDLEADKEVDVSCAPSAANLSPQEMFVKLGKQEVVSEVRFLDVSRKDVRLLLLLPGAPTSLRILSAHTLCPVEAPIDLSAVFGRPIPHELCAGLSQCEADALILRGTHGSVAVLSHLSKVRKPPGPAEILGLNRLTSESTG